MAKFRTKPVVIEAHLWGDSCSQGWPDSWIPIPDDWALRQDAEGVYLEIHTPEGVMRIREGDWIIKGVMGEFSRCKPDLFEATYEPAAAALEARLGAERQGLKNWLWSFVRQPKTFQDAERIADGLLASGVIKRLPTREEIFTALYARLHESVARDRVEHLADAVLALFEKGEKDGS